MMGFSRIKLRPLDDQYNAVGETIRGKEENSWREEGGERRRWK